MQLFKEDHMYKPPKLFEMLSYQNIYPLEGGDKLMKTNNVDGVVWKGGEPVWVVELSQLLSYT